MLKYMTEAWWNTVGIARETKVQLQLLHNLQRRAENVIAIRGKKKNIKKIAVWVF